MKKFGIMTIILLIITLGGMGVAHMTVNGNQQNVTIEETTLSGDKTFADGITVKAKFEDGQNTLNWWTTYSTTEEKVVDCQTDMINDEWVWGPELSMDMTIFGSVTVSEEDVQQYAQYVEEETGIPAETLLEKIVSAEAGKETKYVFAIADYLDYFPVEFNSHTLPGNVSLHVQRVTTDHYDWGVFMENYAYFQTPIPKGLKGILTVKKNKIGELKEWRFDVNRRQFAIESDGVFNTDALYMATSGIGLPGESIDMDSEVVDINAHILDNPPETHGIHYIPLTASGDTYYPQLEEAKCMYFFQPGEEVLQLVESPSGEQLILHSKIDGDIYMTIIDKVSMKELQKTKIMKDTKELYSVILQDHFILTIDMYRNFILLAEENGKWKEQIRGTLHDLPHYPEACAADFDGEKMAFVTAVRYNEEGEDVRSHYRLSVYDKNGLLYDGNYFSSLNDNEMRHHIVISHNSHPIEVSFDGNTQNDN